MTSRRRGVDAVAVTAAAVAVLMALVYVAVIRSQGDEPPAWWVLAVLLVSATLAGLGARRRASHRTALLGVAGVLLVLLGFLAILSIGAPILVAGVLCLVAGARASRAPEARPD